MKKILVSLLLISSLCSFKKEKPAPAFKKGSITTIAAYASPTFFGLTKDKYWHSRHLIAGGEYQISRMFTAGLQYCNYNARWDLQPTKNYFSGTTYQRGSSTKGNYLLAIADLCYLNRGRVSLGFGIGLGIDAGRTSQHIIDSVGISTNPTFPTYQRFGGILRPIIVKVRVKDNLGLYGSLLSFGGIAIGAHYTFIGRK